MLRPVHTKNVFTEKKWVQLISIVLFTLSVAKHQREKSLTLNATFTMNGAYEFRLPSATAFAIKWVPLVSMELFTLSGKKHQRKQLQMQKQMLSVNGLLVVFRFHR